MPRAIVYAEGLLSECVDRRAEFGGQTVQPRIERFIALGANVERQLPQFDRSRDGFDARDEMFKGQHGDVAMAR